MPRPADSVAQRLDERYGRSDAARHRRTAVAGAVLIATVLGAWLAWTTWEQSRPAVASGDLNFEILDDRSAVARMQIDFREEVAARCTIRAFAEDHVIVGELDFSPEPGVSGRVEQSLVTERRATTVELVGCTAPGQPRPR